MKSISLRKLFLLLFLLSLAIGSSNAQIFHKKDPEKQLFGKTAGIKRAPKVKDPGSALRAKRKQERNDRKLKREYDKNVRRSQQRTIDIQTPEVQARMKKNKKEYIARDKEKKKKVKASTRSAGKKYKQ